MGMGVQNKKKKDEKPDKEDNSEEYGMMVLGGVMVKTILVVIV